MVSTRRSVGLLAVSLALLAAWPDLHAQKGPILDAGPPREHVDPGELEPRVRAAAATLDKLDDGQSATPAEWAVICEACGLNPAIHGIALRIKPFPAETLVALLVHPEFAVRTGALEILESKANDDFGFDPWNPSGDASKAALVHWQVWARPANAGKPLQENPPTAEPPLNDAKLRGYFVDLAGSDVSKHERAFEALSRQAMRSVGALEQYLHDTPQLSEGVRAKFKEAECRLVIHEFLPKEAARLARQLIFGTRDLKLDALRQLPRLHEKAVPIIAEFLPDSDALIREAAMDALILSAEEAVYDLVELRLKTEADENVIHAVLRRVSPKTPRGAQLLASFVTAQNEDLAVAALNALSDGASAEAASKLKECLGDKRWRVRVAALEYAGKIRQGRDEVLHAFTDSDEFVRYAAMKAAADMSLSEAVPRITQMALKDNAMVGPAVEAIVRMGQTLPDELVNVLPSKPGDVLLVVLRAFSRHAGHDGHQIEFERLDQSNPGRGSAEAAERAAAQQALQIVRTLAAHRDADVRAAAFHVLGQHLVEVGDKKLVYDALKTAADDEARISILEGIQPGGFDFRESTAPESADGNSIVAEAGDIFAQVLAEAPPRNPDQEAVYNIFGVKRRETAGPAVAVAMPGSRVWEPMDKEFHDLLTAGMESQNGEMAFLCAMHLALGGQNKAATGLLKMLPRLEPHQRAHVAELLAASTRMTHSRAGEPLLRALLQDESQETRQNTVSAILNGSTSAGLRTLLDEVARPNAILRPVDAYNYNLTEAAANSASNRALITVWSKSVLDDANVSSGVKTLALVLLGTAASGDAVEIVQPHLSDPNVWLRRAAWRAFWRLKRTTFESMAATLAGDSSPRVREVLPAAYMKGRSQLDVWFGERDIGEESVPYSRNSESYVLPEGIEPILRKLCADPDAIVRLSAMGALLSWRRELEPLALHETVAALNEDDRRKELTKFLQNDAWRALGPRFGFLIDYLEPAWLSGEWQQIVAALRPNAAKRTQPLTSFASLVKDEPPAPKDDTPVATTSKLPPPATEGTFDVVFFYKPGCKDCERTRDMLHNIGKVVSMKVFESDIETSAGAQWNEALCQRFEVEPSLHQISPAVFTQSGSLVKTSITMGALQRLVDKTLANPAKAGWHVVDEAQLTSAGDRIQSRYSGLHMSLVLAAGFLDGINPCAFATIILFISYLHIARRRPHEILMVGVAFIFAVFLAYFAVGLGLTRVIAQVQAFSWVRIWLNRILALVALLLAWLSFRDCFRAWRGRLGDMTLQLPEFLKTRIRGVIREHSRASNFIIAAFITGIIISFLELACTAQVYLPSIVYMMGRGSVGAIFWLLIYNLAFITPLVIIFLLTYTGMKSDALIGWQKKHTALVRFSTGLLFLALWLVLMIA